MGAKERPGAGGAAAAARILDAAVDALVEHGAGALAMHDVASRAGVSKGLIHYHYHDKDALLADVVVRLGERIAARERAALARSVAASVVDDLRRWMESERSAGEWRALISLLQWPAGPVARAAREGLRERRVAAAGMMAHVFALLAVRPHIAPEQMGALVATAVCGLAVGPGDAEDRAAMDVLVLALLGTGE